MTPRRTKARLSMAVELLASAQSVQWGYELSQRAGVGPGSMYPFLGELFEAGYLSDGWDEKQPGGRPPRRYYRVTEEGKAFLRDFVASAPPAALRRPARVTALRLRPAAEQ